MFDVFAICDYCLNTLLTQNALNEQIMGVSVSHNILKFIYFYFKIYNLLCKLFEICGKIHMDFGTKTKYTQFYGFVGSRTRPCTYNKYK